MREARLWRASLRASTRPFDSAEAMLAGPRRTRHVVLMTAKDKQREERLAAALRENLRRRKEQSRKISAAKKGEAREASRA